MKELSAGMVVYNPRIKKFLVLEYDSHWGFVKGGIEKGEDEKETAERELKEETGIDKFEFVDFKEEITYYYKKEGETMFKKVVFFLITTDVKEVKLSNEHKSYKWCDYKGAYNLAKFKNTRKILEEAKIMVESI
jgi:8-oxo-dGTP pyrophosphatase MutT (NUDIX family)